MTDHPLHRHDDQQRYQDGGADSVPPAPKDPWTCPKCGAEMLPTYEPYEARCPECGYWLDHWTGKEKTFNEPTPPPLEVGKVYKSLAGCPVKLLELVYEGSVQLRLMARVEYVDATNNYGYGQGAIGWFYAGDLTEWVELPTRDDLRAAWLDGSLTLAQYAAAYNQLFPDDPPMPDWKPRWTDE